jgi:DNA-directed RNA polymerase subunit RPC12/RpoP
MTQVIALYKCAECNFQHQSTKLEIIGKTCKCPKCNHINVFAQVIEEVIEQDKTKRLQEDLEVDNSPKHINSTVYRTESENSLSVKKYKSLIIQYPSQDKSEVFAHFPFGGKLSTQWYEPFKKLAELAKTETWGFQRDQFKNRDGNPVPILVNYMKYTFLRLQQEDKISFVEDRAYFNTGLQTPDEKDIFAVFSKNRSPKETKQDWFFNGWQSSYELKGFTPPHPAVASYITDASDLVFDISYEIDVNVEHILDDPENQKRLPDNIRNNRHLAMISINGARDYLKQKCIRNYKTAIPFWYTTDSKIQLLLPLYVNGKEQADLALVADKDKQSKVYRIKTALTMDMAYTNARLITRPDRDWLNP